LAPEFLEIDNLHRDFALEIAQRDFRDRRLNPALHLDRLATFAP
jgi:hypothetical protein